MTGLVFRCIYSVIIRVYTRKHKTLTSVQLIFISNINAVRFYTTIFLLSMYSLCFSQDTVETKNRLTSNVTERFYVLKINPEIKQGLYRALYRRNVAIAIGNYKNNKKTGTWRFSGKDGATIQRFNYDDHNLNYESALDENPDVNFLVDDTLRDCDQLTRPVKPGGVYFGLIPYLNIFQLPFDTYNLDTGEFDAEVELLISQGGRLAEYKVHISSEFYDYEQVFNISVKLFDEEDKLFLPATLSGKPIVSRIIIDCAVNQHGGLDYN